VEGKRLLQGYGCSACHVIPGVPGAVGTTGPSLEDLKGRARLVSGMENTAENLVKWIKDPQAIKPGTLMPKFEVTEKEARDMVAYLRSVE
jgi:cytochrome c1